jgi:hypothetical protein
MMFYKESFKCNYFKIRFTNFMDKDSDMSFKQFYLITLMCFIFLPSYADLPSSSKLTSLKQKVDSQIATYYRIQNGGGTCLEVISAQTKQSGGVVQASACHTGANQKWRLDGARLKLASGKCLQPSGDPKVAGTRLQIDNCNNSTKQQWKYENGQLKTTSNTCIEILPADLKKNGGIVQLAICQAGQHQQWKPL